MHSRIFESNESPSLECRDAENVAAVRKAWVQFLSRAAKQVGCFALRTKGITLCMYLCNRCPVFSLSLSSFGRLLKNTFFVRIQRFHFSIAKNTFRVNALKQKALVTFVNFFSQRVLEKIGTLKSETDYQGAIRFSGFPDALNFMT
jgi:hypothetical protein